MKPTHFELMAKSLGGSIGHSTLLPQVYKYFEILDPHLVFESADEKGQHVSIADMAGLKSKLAMQPKAYLLEAVDGAMFSYMHELVISLFKQWKYGLKTFHFSRGLTTMLHNSDISGTYQFLQFPYKAFYMSFDGCPIWLDAEGDHEQITGVYVDSSRDDLGVFLAISKPSSMYGGASIWLRASVRKDRDPNEKINLAHFNFGGADHNPAIDLAIKALLYLNSSDPDIKPGGAERKDIEAKLKKAKEPQKVERLNKRLELLSAQQYTEVGESIKIKKKDLQGAQDKGGFQGGHHFAYRFWVRGHFRNQAFGPGRTERKLIWIKPHMKGPDSAEVIHKQYEVGG